MIKLQLSPDINIVAEKISHEDFWGYWHLYREIPPEQFALVKLSGECLRKDSLEKIVQDLVNLQTLGLIPVVTFGWGRDLDEILKEARVSDKSIDGVRVTTKKVMPYVLKIAEHNGRTLEGVINRFGGRAMYIGPEKNVFLSEPKDADRYGEFTGNIVGIDTAPVIHAINHHRIPIVSPIGVSHNGKIRYNNNADEAGNQLYLKLGSVKLIMLTSTQGVLDEKGELIREIALRYELDDLKSRGILSKGMLNKVLSIYGTLQNRPGGDDYTAQVAAPGNLLKELFTRKGEGTLIRNGYEIVFAPVKHFVPGIIRYILEEAFNKKLVEGYFAEPNMEVGQERVGKGAVTVIPNAVEDVAYLNSFGVINGYQKNGVGKDLFAAMVNRFGKIFWRSDPRRGIKDFYVEQSSGSQDFVSKDGHLYRGYYRGLDITNKKDSLLIVKLFNYMSKRANNFI